MTDRRHTWRIVTVAVVVTAALGGLGARLAFLHLGPHEALRERVQETRKVEQQILVGRGRILDCHGNIMAMDLAVKNVCADPKMVTERGHVRFIGSHLARLLRLDPAMVFTRLSRPHRRFAYIKRFVPTDTAEDIARMQLPGVFFEETTARHYPHGTLMSHVLGFANTEGIGSAGIEQRMHKYLKGSPGFRVSERDGRRRELVSRRSLEIPAREGSDVYLTLDQTVQYIVEKELDQAMEEHNAKGAWAIVQRIRTGEILAMASRPTYDLNEYRTSSLEAMRNRALSYLYEPGSTFKPAVIAAALEEGVVNPGTVVDCEEGCWIYRGRPLRDYHSYDQLSVADVLKKSSNIGAAKVALMLNEAAFEERLRAFGVGKRTGVGLPGEQAGIFHSCSSWSGISATRIAMGHEVSVTALQMLNLVCAIANDGFLMKPLIVSRVVDVEGRTIMQSEPEVLARPIRMETSARMRRLLARVTEEGGTGTRARIDGYTVAGKTGTAQKPLPTGGYSDSAHMASFVGFLPVEEPEIGIIVVVDDPQPLHTGGSVAAPVFRRIGEQLVRCLDIPPDPSSRPDEEQVDAGRMRRRGDVS